MERKNKLNKKIMISELASCAVLSTIAILIAVCKSVL